MSTGVATAATVPRMRSTLAIALLLGGCQASAPATEPEAPVVAVPVASAPPVAESYPAMVEPVPEPLEFARPSHLSEPAPDALLLDSGLATVVIRKGDGSPPPKLHDRVTVHYVGWLTDGHEFDSSLRRERPATFTPRGVIKGWTEGLQLMSVGERRRLWIPSELAYGETPRSGAPAGPLIFDIELISIARQPGPPETPDDVAAPSATSVRTPSGLAFEILRRGTGTRHPNATSRVTVHYSGWTTDGKVFDSSVTRGRPATFGLDQVIKGWTEGVQLMAVGDKTRFWIPPDLAYGTTPKRPGAPAGLLVFDIELLEIK
jgi:FKBP-type peptidyl-prolyl cis-trans isomerase